MLRRLVRLTTAAGFLAGALMPAAAAVSPSPGRSNPRPHTIPALRVWHGGHGRVRVSVGARIVVPAIPGVHNTKWVTRMTFLVG